MQQTGFIISNQFINKRNIPAHCVIIKHHNQAILKHIKSQFIKVSSTNAQYVDLKHHIVVLLMHIFSQNIK